VAFIRPHDHSKHESELDTAGVREQFCTTAPTSPHLTKEGKVMSATSFLPRLLDEVEAPVAPVRLQRQTAPITQSLADEYVHPAAIAIALGGFGLFLVASWAGWAFDYMSLLVKVIYVLSLMYFVPFIEFGQSSAKFRGEVTHRSFMQFLSGRVQTFTGSISGSAALIQIALMPIALGCLMCFFAVLWLSVRG
jgi:hypothetical protein